MTTPKHDYIKIRCSSEQQREFEEAASFADMDLSDFFRHAAGLYAATIRREYQISLSKQGGMRFLDAIENPPEAKTRLREAMRRHENGKNLHP